MPVDVSVVFSREFTLDSNARLCSSKRVFLAFRAAFSFVVFAIKDMKVAFRRANFSANGAPPVDADGAVPVGVSFPGWKTTKNRAPLATANTIPITIHSNRGEPHPAINFFVIRKS